MSRVSELKARRIIAETVMVDTITDRAGSSTLNATIAELNAAADLSAQVAMAPAAGFLGTGTIYKSSVTKEGEFIYTRIYIDLTGTKSTTTDRDIIGNTGAAYIGRITAAINGTVVGGTMTCLEAPTTGVTDIDLYAATAATGAYDADANALAGAAALVSAGGAWTIGTTKGMTALPAADAYLYLANGAAGTIGTYDAGKFMLTFIGV
jgi:hypothetical protein